MNGDRSETRPAERPATFGAALRNRGFAVLYAAETQSTAGTQLARVALSVLVYQRTGSTPATALAYASTYLPSIIGGLLLAPIGDHWSRRPLMVGCDALRAALFALMALPGWSTAALILIAALAVLVNPVFSAAQTSYLAVALDRETFRAATGLRMLTNQGAQVAGFAVGGVIVGALGARTGLLVNAATFALSAVVIAVLLPRAAGAAGESPAGREPAVEPAVEPVVEPGPDRPRASTVMGELLRSPQVWTPMALSALAGLFVVPEALAVPFTDRSGGSTSSAGLLMASIPLGSVVGVIALLRVPAVRRRRVAYAMAIACGVPLVPSGFTDHWQLAMIGWFFSGVFAAYQVEVLSAIVQATPDRVRARVVGLANSVLLGAQGVGFIAFGEVADRIGPDRAVAWAGGLGSALAAIVVTVHARHTRRDLASPARHRAGAPVG